jgi:hypothetical protein
LQKKNEGQPTIFLLIETLKEYLEKFNYDYIEGFFSLLNDELIIKIFSYLNARELCILSKVNKNFKRLSEDEKLWKEICQKEIKYQNSLKNFNITKKFILLFNNSKISQENKSFWKKTIFKYIGPQYSTYGIYC